MNNNKIEVIVKRPRKPTRNLKDLEEITEKYIGVEIVNAFSFYRENMAEDCKGMYLQGYIRGINQARRLTKKRIRNPLNTPGKDPFKNWKEDLPGVSTKKEHFVLGFTTALYYALTN